MPQPETERSQLTDSLVAFDAADFSITQTARVAWVQRFCLCNSVIRFPITLPIFGLLDAILLNAEDQIMKRPSSGLNEDKLRTEREHAFTLARGWPQKLPVFSVR